MNIFLIIFLFVLQDAISSLTTKKNPKPLLRQFYTKHLPSFKPNNFKSIKCSIVKVPICVKKLPTTTMKNKCEIDYLKCQLGKRPADAKLSTGSPVKLKKDKQRRGSQKLIENTLSSKTIKIKTNKKNSSPEARILPTSKKFGRSRWSSSSSSIFYSRSSRSSLSSSSSSSSSRRSTSSESSSLKSSSSENSTEILHSKHMNNVSKQLNSMIMDYLNKDGNKQNVTRKGISSPGSSPSDYTAEIEVSDDVMASSESSAEDDVVKSEANNAKNVLTQSQGSNIKKELRSKDLLMLYVDFVQLDDDVVKLDDMKEDTVKAPYSRTKKQELELVARYPCAMSAPYYNMNSQGLVKEPLDKDEIQDLLVGP